MTDTTPDQLDATLAAADAAAGQLAATSPTDRAGWIRAAADALDGAAEELVPIAMSETGLAEARLRGEVARSTGQLRMFAEVLEDGTLLEVVIDTADPNAQPVPRPDIRRTLVPLGPVLVFAASNFPFAFSVCGGDTASALAAGCPVVVKAHPGHPELSIRTAEVMFAALREAPDGTLGLISGVETGIAALKDRRIRAAGFTGSVPGGLALHEIAANRPDPIPFYGELGSLNPVFVTAAAVKARGADIVSGYVQSFTLGAGQFCTKPGLLFLPANHGLTDQLADAVRTIAGARMLNEKIQDGFSAGLGRLRQITTTVSQGAGATLLRTTVPELLERRDEMLRECFGPVSILVEYADEAALVAGVEAFGGNLTATIHAEPEDAELAARLMPLLTERAGRVIWNGWPTGVAVTWAMQHGGPFPATVGSVHTSVGVTAARRFQRPVCYQNTPDTLLPPALQNANPLAITRRLNGSIE